MPTYITKEITKRWRRIGHEFSLEWPILCDKWKFILFGLLFQYVHGVAARSAHFLHQPAEVLHDMGFLLLPELGKERAYMSETTFLFIVVPFVAWTFHPFVFYNQRFYTVLLWVKVLCVLVICQFCRILSFTATQLPGPNYHCRVGSPAATLPPPKNIQDVVVLNLSRGVLFGCGDLIFSSHMTFSLTMVLTYNKFGTTRWLKQIGWLLAVTQSLLIVAARKHYSVDVVVAWYVVPLVFYFVHHHRFFNAGGEHLPDREVSAIPLLPVVDSEHKNARSKEDHTRPVAAKDSERRKHLATNGKHSGDEAEYSDFESTGSATV